MDEQQSTNTHHYSVPFSIPYQPTSPTYYPTYETNVSPPPYIPKSGWFFNGSNHVVTFDLDELVMERIEKETRKWGTLLWRNPKLGDRFWGHVYLTIDTKIMEIIKEYYGNSGLIEKVVSLMNEEIPNQYSKKIVEYNVFNLSCHFSVIRHQEWQSKFFNTTPDEFFNISNPSTHQLTSPIEYVGSSYISHGKHVKNEKFKQLLNLMLFKKSQFALHLPQEIIQFIGEFIIISELKESNRKFNFKLNGKISATPRCFKDQVGFVIHVESEELQGLRRGYGLDGLDFIIPVGLVSYEECQLLPECLGGPLVVNDLSVKRKRKFEFISNEKEEK